MIIPCSTSKLQIHDSNPRFIAGDSVFHFTSNGTFLFRKENPKYKNLHITQERIFVIERGSIEEYATLELGEAIHEYSHNIETVDDILLSADRVYVVYRENDLRVLFDLIGQRAVVLFESTSDFCLVNNVFFYSKESVIYKHDLEAKTDEVVLAIHNLKRFVVSGSNLVYSDNNRVFIYNFKTRNVTQYHSHSNRIKRLYIDRQDRMVYSVCKEKILQFNINEEIKKIIISHKNNFIALYQTRSCIFIHTVYYLIIYDKITHRIINEVSLMGKDTVFMGYYTPGSIKVARQETDIIPRRNKKVKLMQRPIVKSPVKSGIYVLFHRPFEIILHDFYSHALIDKYPMVNEISSAFFHDDTLIVFNKKSKRHETPQIVIYKLNTQGLTYLCSIQMRLVLKDIETALFYNKMLYIKTGNRVLVCERNGTVHRTIYNMTQVTTYKDTLLFLKGRASIVCENSITYLKHPISRFEMYANKILFINANGFYEFKDDRTKRLLDGKFTGLCVLNDNALLSSKNGVTIYSLKEDQVTQKCETDVLMKTAVTPHLLINREGTFILSSDI